MNDMPFEPKRKKIHAGFAVGLVCVLIMIPVNLVLLLLFQGNRNSDWVSLGIQLQVYFFASQVAAQNQYNKQERSLEALRGVRGAGIGAALTTSLFMWVYILIRDLVMDALGSSFDLEIFFGFCVVVIDVLLALALGAWGGSIVEKKYKFHDDYNSNSF